MIAGLERHGQRAAARLVAGWPHQGGVLDADHVDGVLLRSHGELQRLSEEFQQGRRALRLLGPLVATLRAAGVPPPYRVVDVGCGLGYVLRWLAADGGLGEDVELLGCDYNATFIGVAQQLTAAEGLRCSFRVANGFRLDEPATIYTSTAVIHHFRGPSLERFLAEQGENAAQAFVHFDTKPSWLAPLGAWLFHRARMREPLARHDGVLSAARAHSARVLLDVTRRTCPGFDAAVFDGMASPLPILRVMQALVAVRGGLMPQLRTALGPLAARLVDAP